MYYIQNSRARRLGAVAFIETAVFTRRVIALGLEPGVRTLQEALSVNPTASALEPGTGGLRKVRMPDVARATGKRGGARVHYLHMPRHAVIYLLYVYAKRDTDALNADQRRALKAAAAALEAEWDESDARDETRSDPGGNR